MDFKEHFEKFEADIRKRFLDDEFIRNSLKSANKQHEELMNKLEALLFEFDKNRKLPEDPFFTNEEFVSLMNISVRTAQLWRDKGLISYSQISGKIYYRLSDIQNLLNENYHQSKKECKL